MKILLTALFAVMVFGCSTTQPVTHGTKEKYSWGTYSGDYATSLLELHTAIRATCMQAKVIEDFRINREKSCSYQYHDVNGTRLAIDTYERKDGTVRMKMRAGGTGDKEVCQTLLMELEKHLLPQQN